MSAHDVVGALDRNVAAEQVTGRFGVPLPQAMIASTLAVETGRLATHAMAYLPRSLAATIATPIPLTAVASLLEAPGGAPRHGLDPALAQPLGLASVATFLRAAQSLGTLASASLLKPYRALGEFSWRRSEKASPSSWPSWRSADPRTDRRGDKRDARAGAVRDVGETSGWRACASNSAGSRALARRNILFRRGQSGSCQINLAKAGRRGGLAKRLSGRA
jgi:hypothetical protein